MGNVSKFTIDGVEITVKDNNAVSILANQGLSENQKANARTNIGLGNVPNVATNNQTPTFTQASSRANIASGETLTTIFGKIMKWFTDLKTVAFSGSYSDLSNKPTIPTVNNGTLTIQKNGTNVAAFNANQSGNTTANITVPTKVSDLTQNNNWVKLGTASISTAATFANIANAGYHDMMIVVRLNAGADFRFSETFAVNTFDNGAILTRLGYMTNPSTDFNWVQVSLDATSMSIGAVFSSFTVTSCYADLYVKK